MTFGAVGTLRHCFAGLEQPRACYIRPGHVVAAVQLAQIISRDSHLHQPLRAGPALTAGRVAGQGPAAAVSMAPAAARCVACGGPLWQAAVGKRGAACAQQQQPARRPQGRGGTASARTKQSGGSWGGRGRGAAARKGGRGGWRCRNDRGCTHTRRRAARPSVLCCACFCNHLGVARAPGGDVPARAFCPAWVAQVGRAGRPRHARRRAVGVRRECTAFLQVELGRPPSFFLRPAGAAARHVSWPKGLFLLLHCLLRWKAPLLCSTCACMPPSASDEAATAQRATCL